MNNDKGFYIWSITANSMNHPKPSRDHMNGSYHDKEIMLENEHLGSTFYAKTKNEVLDYYIECHKIEQVELKAKIKKLKEWNEWAEDLKKKGGVI